MATKPMGQLGGTPGVAGGYATQVPPSPTGGLFGIFSEGVPEWHLMMATHVMHAWAMHSMLRAHR